MSAALQLQAELLPGEGDFVAVDFETADEGRDSACSIAVVRVHDNNRGAAGLVTRSSLLRPPRPTSKLAHFHHITEAMQRKAPTLAEVWPTLAPLFEGASLIVAHNAAFDLSVMRHSFGIAGITPPGLPWACTVAMSKKRWPKPTFVDDHKLPTLAQLHRLSLRHHDAESDAKACANLVLIARAEDRGERPAPAVRAKALQAPAPAPRPLPAVVVPREPEPDDPDVVTPLRALRWGQQARQQGGDVIALQEQLGDPWVRALVSCGWTLEGLDRDLRSMGRLHECPVESRFEALVRVLERPRRSPPDFVELVRRYFQVSDRRWREWKNSNPDQRKELDKAKEEAEDAVREALGVLLMGGGR